MQPLVKVEWVTDALYWTSPLHSNGVADLRRVNPDGGYNKIVASVRDHIHGYEAVIKRPRTNWELGVLPSVAEAKDAIISALVLNKLEH
jgi:hypothetical protein